MARTLLFNRIDRLTLTVAKPLAWASVICLAAIVCLTVTDTALRYIANRPVSGSNEMVEILMSFLIMLALPFCTANRAHIRVDLLDNALGKIGCLIADVLTGGLSIVVLYFLSERCWRKAKEALEFGDATVILKFPHWALYGTISFMIGLTALILFAQIAKSLFGGAAHE